MQNSTNLLLVTAFAIQSGTAFYDAGVKFISNAVPAPIEGSAVGPDNVRAGSVAMVTWQIVKRIDCAGFNSRVWDGEDGFHITEALTPTGLPTSDSVRTYVIPTDIPQLAPNGDLSLTIKGFYDCPNARKEHFTLGPVKMNVIGNPAR